MTSLESPQRTTSIDPATKVGLVALTVADLDRSLAFYTRALGLAELRRDGREVVLGAGGVPLLLLREQPGALPWMVDAMTGLYHFAILVPTRSDLARSLRHLSEAGQRFSGFADHLVSESLYLADPDGNGIEIYRDRPRAEWPREADGSYRLDTLPLDLDGLLGELAGGGDAVAWHGLPHETRMGHVHLQVSDRNVAEAFYVDVLGMDVMARYGSSASFIAAGGYHHHVGMNTWASLGGEPPPSGAAGLRHFEILLSSAAERDRVADRVVRAGGRVAEGGGGILTRDPSGNGIALVAASGAA